MRERADDRLQAVFTEEALDNLRILRKALEFTRLWARGKAYFVRISNISRLL